MADEIKGPDPGDRIENTDLSHERPTPYVGSPWRTEPTGIRVGGRAAEMLVSVLCMLVSVLCMLTILAALHRVFGMNLYHALVVAVLVPWLYQGAGIEGGGKVGVALKLWWGRRRQR